MPNLLTNQRFDSWPELRTFYNEFFWDTRHQEWMQDYGTYRRLRMIISQYQAYRSKVRQFKSLQEILEWMNGYGHEVMMVPMNYVDNRRLPSQPERVEISQVWHTPDINVAFRFFPGSDEELHGPGVMLTMSVFPRKGNKFDPDAWRFGLASYGIYSSEGQWTDDYGKHHWDFEVTILDADFTITDTMNPKWAFSMPNDQDDEISDWEDANNRAWAIEEGLEDYEVFGDSYSR